MADEGEGFIECTITCINDGIHVDPNVLEVHFQNWFLSGGILPSLIVTGGGLFLAGGTVQFSTTFEEFRFIVPDIDLTAHEVLSDSDSD